MNEQVTYLDKGLEPKLKQLSVVQFLFFYFFSTCTCIKVTHRASAGEVEKEDQEK